MSLHVLSDGDVRALLAGLDAAQLDGLFDTLSNALQTYSIGNEKQYQCHRQGVTRPGQATMLFMPATLPDGCSVKVVGVPPPTPAAPATPADPAKPPKGLTGVVMICDEDGRAVGVLNAAALTAFRTSLGSILLYRFRAATRHIVVFGAGKQALWHVRLALLLRRADIATVTVVNRSAARAHAMIDECQKAPTGASGGADWDTSHIAFRFVDAATEELVQQADVIFCTTPSKVPLFPAEWLTAPAARQQKTRFISAIGSYKLDMQELDPALLRTVATDYPGSFRLGAAGSSGSSGSTLLVDSRDACAVEAGELVLAKIPDEQLMETGELMHFRGSPDSDAAEKQRLDAWLRDGNVIYKSVGIGIMDLSIGRALLQLGASLGVGTTIAQF